jgi:hypothetical protein
MPLCPPKVMPCRVGRNHRRGGPLPVVADDSAQRHQVEKLNDEHNAQRNLKPPLRECSERDGNDPDEQEVVARQNSRPEQRSDASAAMIGCGRSKCQSVKFPAFANNDKASSSEMRKMTIAGIVSISIKKPRLGWSPCDSSDSQQKQAQPKVIVVFMLL